MEDNQEKVDLKKAHAQSDEQKTKPKRHISIKAIGIVVLAIAVIGLIIFGVIKLFQWRNDGAKFAGTLSEQIGVSAETAQKYAHITLENASQYACVNQVAGDYKYLYESKRSVTVSGVKIPQWVIYVGEKNGIVTDINYYDYAQLQKFGSGVKVSAHVDPAGVIAGMDPATVQTYTGFKPLRVSYTVGGMEEAYKYYYKDANTGNTVSYILRVNYENGLAVSATEEENQFILSVLTIS
ncbi:MAG: hypothetical protein K5695_02455 [Oscillospiraceae bacterium]|nr:hypothetical protein [Oscillospiraceae bacterium]